MRTRIFLLTMLISGHMAVAQNVTKVDQGRPGNQGPWPVTGTFKLADGGVVTVLFPTVPTASQPGACPSGGANFMVVAANAARKSVFIWGDPSNTDDVFVKLGVTASAASARLAPGQALNIDSSVIYTGQIDAFPASGTQGVCRVEL
jgi:hypothetical protein